MSQQYVLEVETTERDHDVAERWVDKLSPWHGVVSSGPTGNLTITLSLPAEGLAQACATGLAIASRLATPAAVTALPETLRDKREGWSPLPQLVSVAEAAGLLGVTRQRVLQMIDEGKLPATRIGKVYGIDSAALRPPGEAD